MQDEGIERETTAIFMLAVVLGGLAFQVPVCRLSDRFDRRLVLSLLSFGFAAVASVARIRNAQTVGISTPSLNCVAAWRSAGLERIMSFSNSTTRKNRIPPPTSQGQTQSGSDSLPKIAWKGGA